MPGHLTGINVFVPAGGTYSIALLGLLTGTEVSHPLAIPKARTSSSQLMMIMRMKMTINVGIRILTNSFASDGGIGTFLTKQLNRRGYTRVREGLLPLFVGVFRMELARTMHSSAKFLNGQGAILDYISIYSNFACSSGTIRPATVVKIARYTLWIRYSSAMSARVND